MSPIQAQLPPVAPRAVFIVSFPEVQLLDVAGPMQVFACANERLAAAGRRPAYEVRVVAPQDRITASAGMRFEAGALPDAREAIDTLVVAGGRGVMDVCGDPLLTAWLRQASQRARRTASVCTGAFLLGAAGLLDGRRAVTHWHFCDELARRHPKVRVEPDPIFVRDGDVWTSAGVTAGIDLALALVEQDLGHAIALDIARVLVVFLKRPGSQAQYSGVLSLQRDDDLFSDLHAWIGDHLNEDMSLRRLSEQAGMSERTFTRRYRERSGATPMAAVERIRIEAARRLLTETDQPIKRIVRRCGFRSEDAMRRAFRRCLDTTPNDYRQHAAG